MSCVLLVFSRDCPNFSAKPSCTYLIRAPQHRNLTTSSPDNHPHQSALHIAIMGGGGKIPYARLPNAYREQRLTCPDTQSTSGRRPVVGTPNPPTGKPTPPSWASSSAASSEWHGWSAQTESTATRCPSRAASFPADSKIRCLAHGAIVEALALTWNSWSKQIIEHERKQKQGVLDRTVEG